MNCKPGDLAIIIRDIDGFDHERYPGVTFIAKTAGRVVTTRALDENAEAPAWIIDKPFDTFVTGEGFKGIGEVVVVADADLRPIRDNDADDETLTWAGKPEGVAA